MRQVISAERNELQPGEWDYYTKAAFDFLICNDDRGQSYELVIEYDGRQHNETAQARKDSLKNRLCLESGLPIIRIGVENIKKWEGVSLLEYMLDVYFGEKAANEMKREGRLSEEEDFFIGTRFPGTTRIIKRLLKRGVLPAIFTLSADKSSEEYFWYRVRDTKLFHPSENTENVWKGACAIDLMKGNCSEKPICTVEKEAQFKEYKPNHLAPGVHSWFLVLEFARFLAFRSFEEELEKRHLYRT